MECRLIGTILFSFCILSCRPTGEMDMEFRERLAMLDSGVVRFSNATEVIDRLSARIVSGGDVNRGSACFEAYSNTVINVPIVRTNNLTRERYPRGGVIQGPYQNMVPSYREFVHTALGKVGYTNGLDRFCLELEVWKRLSRELAQSDALMDLVARASVEYGSEALADIYKRNAKSSLEGQMHEIEYCLERFYRKESDESRRAYELFRQVIGREAVPPYKRNRD